MCSRSLLFTIVAECLADLTNYYPGQGQAGRLKNSTDSLN